MGKKKKRQPTMSDVARAARVSQTTVSFVVNEINDAGITEETKRRVLQAIEELGYRPRIPKRFRRQQSGFICLVADNVVSTLHGHRLVQGVQEEAWSRGTSVVIAETGFPGQPDGSLVEKLIETQSELVIYATLAHEHISPPSVFYDRHVVLLNCRDEDKKLVSVVPQEYEAEKLATTILIDKGHSRIGFIGGQKFEIGIATMERFRGYSDALKEAEIPLDESLLRFGADIAESGYEFAYRLLDRPDRPTALVCYNDQVAMGAYRAIFELGLKIPDDVAVVGFDNLEIIAGSLWPGLSTLELPHFEMGRRAVRSVLSRDRSTGDGSRQQRIECPYVERGSV
jgi:LacI family transcriptional regulator